MDAPTLREAMLNQIPLARAQQEITAANEALQLAGCTTVNRAAMFLAQLGHESASLRYATELASGAAYNGRKDLGNIYPGDGPRYRGRSYIQVTGRHNFGLISAWAHSKGLVSSPTYFVDNPERLSDTRWAWVGPVWYWTVARPSLNAASDAGDTTRATKLINGGTNGLADRVNRWNRCRALGNALLPSGGPVTLAAPGPPPEPPRRRSRREPSVLYFKSPEPAAGTPKQDWPTILVPYAFDPSGGWGGKCILKVDWFGRGGWLKAGQWWVRDPNWSANVPIHFPQDHPVGANGSERYVGFGWQTAPPVGADSIQITTSCPDGLTIDVVYEK